jgi:hypothetical protein
MTTLTFSSVTIQVYQASDFAYDIQAKSSRLYSGQIYTSISDVTSFFPRTFLCHTDLWSEITALTALIGTYGTLVIDGTSYTNCYISGFSSVHNLIDGTGKYTYSISFGKSDQR